MSLYTDHHAQFLKDFDSASSYLPNNTDNVNDILNPFLNTLLMTVLHDTDPMHKARALRDDELNQAARDMAMGFVFGANDYKIEHPIHFSCFDKSAGNGMRSLEINDQFVKDFVHRRSQWGDSFKFFLRQESKDPIQLARQGTPTFSMTRPFFVYSPFRWEDDDYQRTWITATRENEVFNPDVPCQDNNRLAAPFIAVNDWPYGTPIKTFAEAFSPFFCHINRAIVRTVVKNFSDSYHGTLPACYALAVAQTRRDISPSNYKRLFAHVLHDSLSRFVTWFNDSRKDVTVSLCRLCEALYDFFFFNWHRSDGSGAFVYDLENCERLGRGNEFVQRICAIASLVCCIYCETVMLCIDEVPAFGRPTFMHEIIRQIDDHTIDLCGSTLLYKSDVAFAAQAEDCGLAHTFDAIAHTFREIALSCSTVQARRLAAILFDHHEQRLEYPNVERVEVLQRVFGRKSHDFDTTQAITGCIESIDFVSYVIKSEDIPFTVPDHLLPFLVDDGDGVLRPPTEDEMDEMFPELEPADDLLGDTEATFLAEGLHPVPAGLIPESDSEDDDDDEGDDDEDDDNFEDPSPPPPRTPLVVREDSIEDASDLSDMPDFVSQEEIDEHSDDDKENDRPESIDDIDDVPELIEDFEGHLTFIGARRF